jgi:hypothetical protein
MPKVRNKFLYSIYGILAISIVCASLIYGLSSVYISPTSSDDSSTALKYNSRVCTYKTPWLGDHYGDSELVGCSHNVLYNNGKNMTRDLLGYGGVITGNISTIALCNASTGSPCGTPVAAATEAFITYNSCGLDNSTGAYTILNSYDGNWTISKTFTSTCDNRLVNATRLQNASGSIFAGNTFTLVTL